MSPGPTSAPDRSTSQGRSARRDLDDVAVAGGAVHRLGVDEVGGGWDLRGRHVGHTTGPISSVWLAVMQYTQPARAVRSWRLAPVLEGGWFVLLADPGR